MEFKKYQHIERFGNKEVENITNGECYIFPKIDGSNGSVWTEKETIFCGSRSRVLTLDNDNAGFMKYVFENDNLKRFFSKYPNCRLYGEWLVPHSLKTYRKDSWEKFYIFDVMEKNNYLHYEDYKILLDEFDLDYIPPLCKVTEPSYERLLSILEQNLFLIKDGSGWGEGIVIKNYNYVNQFGRTIWAKIIDNKFKDKHLSSFKVREIKEKENIEEKIINDFLTENIIEKVYQKIVVENNGWYSKFIPRLLQTCFYDLIREESWNFIKKFKNPTINYSMLNFLATRKIKEIKKELF